MAFFISFGVINYHVMPKINCLLSLYAFVNLKHHGQVRKYTGEPYFNHLIAVAEMADGKVKFGYEIGLCHDLLEDTDCKKLDLTKALLRFNYAFVDADYITKKVVELTDVYTPENYPNFNRAKRKTMEAGRLSMISREAQTVKYCDLINNSESILKHDPGFAKVYLKEKAEILSVMNKGSKVLLKKCLNIVNQNLSAIT